MKLPTDILSVVVPFYNEADNVRFVLEELRSALPDAEIIAVDDGSSDQTWQRILVVAGVPGLRLKRNLGQSGAIYYGLRACTRPVCGLMDGDGQNDPASFHRLLAEFQRGDVDVVCGFRANRHDSWNRRAASRFANSLRRRWLNDGIQDPGCSQKIFRREAVELLVPFRGMHRYLPALFKQAGLKIVEVPVRHHPRRTGKSKYNNWSRAKDGIYDLIGVAWLLNRKIARVAVEKKP
jgi:dolichol-phosphate mannosyltransferase